MTKKKPFALAVYLSTLGTAQTIVKDVIEVQTRFFLLPTFNFSSSPWPTPSLIHQPSRLDPFPCNTFFFLLLFLFITSLFAVIVHLFFLSPKSPLFLTSSHQLSQYQDSHRQRVSSASRPANQRLSTRWNLEPGAST